MWKRKELKEIAKKTLKKNYWTIIIVCFIMAICTGEYGLSSVSVERNFESADITSEIQKAEEGSDNTIGIGGEEGKSGDITQTYKKAFEDSMNSSVNSLVKTQKYVYKIVDGIAKLIDNAQVEAVFLFISAVVAFAFVVFVADPLIVGEKRFFIKARKNSKTKIGVITTIFKKGEWTNIAKTMLIKNIFMFGWVLLIFIGSVITVIPELLKNYYVSEYVEGILTMIAVIVGITLVIVGIVMFVIKSYEYRMIPYLLAENPHFKEKEIFKLTKQMMKGNKWKTFVLDLSFILWYFLSMLTLGLVAILYVNPYTEATRVELYAYLRNEAVKKKYVYSERLVEAKQQATTK